MINLLLNTKAEIAWNEEGDSVQIQINLPWDDPLSSLLLKQNTNKHADTQLSDRSCIPGIFVRNGIRFDRILYQDILYLEAQGAYTLICTKEKDFTLSRNLTNCSKELTYPFMRVHRSYTINLENIDSFTESNVFYREQRIPVSEPHRKELLAYFNRI